MSTNVNITLDKRKRKADGTYPIILRLGHDRKTTSISLGVSVSERVWDHKNRIIKNSYSGSSSVARLNNFIQKKKSNALDIIVRLNDNHQLQMLSILDLKKRIVANGSSASFFEFSENLISELEEARRIGTARSYSGAISVLRKFNRGKDLHFKDINYAFLNRFENAHLKKGLSYNGLAVYMRTIRAIINKAIKAGEIERDLYPFTDYKIKTVPTRKRAIEWLQIKKIINLELPADHACFDARNFFIASYLMYGMNFTDIAHLKHKDIVSGRVKYRREKSSKLYDIKITDALQAIFDFYKADKSSAYVFPIIKRKSPKLIDKDIQWARKRYNKKLKQIASMCSIPENLTSYVSRHSFATHALLQDVPINAISAMLGHSSLKTTEIYLKSLPTNILDEYNANIIGQ